ncbi:MAG: protein-disulfide reductase DsbD [Marinobacterium sp.]|nr:protein-disulfide reductase DsbD [Marinobacterium sp.]
MKAFWKNALPWLLALVVMLPGTVAAQGDFLPVEEAFKPRATLTENGVELQWQIHEGYYLYKKQLKFSTAKGVEARLGEPQYHSTALERTDKYFGTVKVFRQQLKLFLPVRGAAGELKIRYQGCADAGLCYLPQTLKVNWPGNITTAAAMATGQETEKEQPVASDTASSSGLMGILQQRSPLVVVAIFFLLGLGLTFTPCVLPMLPILSAIVVGQKDQSRRHALILSSCYVLGMALTYTAAGVITASLGAAANIQAAMQQPWLLVTFAALFVALALAMFGLYELQLPAFIRDRLAGQDDSQGKGLGGVFLMGAISALVVSPCVSAPLAGAMLYISTTGDQLLGGAVLFAMALGMGVPLVLVTTLGANWLPRAGNWMNTVKAVFGVMLLAVAISLLGRLLSDATALIIWGLFLITLAVVTGALEAAVSLRQRLQRAAAIILLLVGTSWLLGGLAGNGDPLRPLQFNLVSNGSAAASTPKRVLASASNLQQALSQASAEQRYSLVKVSADWCVSCKVMEKEIFARADVKQLLKEVEVITFDVTDNSEAQQVWLQQHGVFGPPALVLYDRQGKELIEARVIGETDYAGFIGHIQRFL